MGTGDTNNQFGNRTNEELCREPAWSRLNSQISLNFASNAVFTNVWRTNPSHLRQTAVPSDGGSSPNLLLTTAY